MVAISHAQWQSLGMDTHRRSHQEIACQQVLVEDFSVFSIQWSTLPGAASGLTPRSLWDRYLSHIRRSTLSIIQPVTSAHGIEFRLRATRWSLISFLTPREEGNAIIMPICGGLLVQKCPDKPGELRFMVEPGPTGTRVTVQLSDYRPRILGAPPPSKVRYWLYRLTQAAIHRWVTVRFLVLLCRDLSGVRPCVTVRDGQVRQGHPL